MSSQFSTSAWEPWLIWRIWIVLGLKAKGTLLAVCCVELSILAIQKLTSVKLYSGLGAANSHADTRYIGFDKGHIYRKVNLTWHSMEKYLSSLRNCDLKYKSCGHTRQRFHQLKRGFPTRFDFLIRKLSKKWVK